MPTVSIGRTLKSDGKRPEDADRFPSYSAFLRSLDSFLAAQSLSPKSRCLAKAFAVAAYRRALAQRTGQAVKTLVSEAIANAIPPSPTVTLEGRSRVYHIGYAFGSRRSKRRKSRKSATAIS